VQYRHAHHLESLGIWCREFYYFYSHSDT